MAATDVLTHKLLASGQLNNAVAELGKPAAGKKWYLKGILLFNTNSTVETVKLYAHGTNAANQFFEYDMDPKESFFFSAELEYPISLAATEPIAGNSTVASQVNYFVYGAEQDS